MDVEQRHGHVFRDLELRRRDRVGCNLVGRDGQCDDIPRLHRISRQFASGHRIGNQLLGRDRVCRQLVHRDGIGLDLLGGHGIHGEMLRGHRASSEDVVRHEVEWLESRTVPRQDFHHTIGQGHQDARTVVRRARPVRIKIGQHGR